MSEHYYTENPEAKHDIKYLHTSFFGKEFTFKTDAGVFSKSRVDFGSSLLIRSFKASEGSKILDVGCGYGPIGIVTASTLNKGKVILLDVNERALGLAAENVDLNKRLIKDTVDISIVQSYGFENVGEKDYDYILLNPPIRAGKSLIYQMFEDAYNHLRMNGEFWIVIQKKQGAPSALKKLETLFTKVEEVDRNKGYFVFKSVK